MKRNRKNLVVVLAAMGMLVMGGCSATAAASAPNDPASTATPSASATSTPPIATPSTGTSGDTSVGTNDGQTVTVPWVSGAIVANGDTRDSTTMPSIHKLLPDCGILKTWGDLVACVDKNNAQWYRDGINRYAARSGFSWDDVVRWSTAKNADGKLVESRVIMLTGKMADEHTGLTDAEANERVKTLTNNTTLQVIRLTQNGYTNTWRAGSTTSPDMTTFVDYNDEVRVGLAPYALDINGNIVGLNGDHMFSGVFADCLNDHWIDVITPSNPKVVACPPGTELAGQPLPAGGYAGCSPSKPPTLTPKNPKNDVKPPQGTTPLGTGPVTDGKVSSGQKASGDTSGSVTDSKVPAGTGSGTTTGDLGSGSGVTAPGASSGGSTTGAVTGPGTIPSGSGGTGGGTQISGPDNP